MNTKTNEHPIGKSFPRKEGRKKVTGQALYIAEEIVKHPEEPILLLAHKDKYMLEEARRNVRVEIQEQPGVFSLQDSLARKETIWGEDNVFKTFLVDKGNVDD